MKTPAGHENVQQVIANAVRWAAPCGAPPVTYWHFKSILEGK